MDGHYDFIYKPPIKQIPLPNHLKFSEDSYTLSLGVAQEDCETPLQCEFGSSMPIDVAEATAYNAQGEEIEIPKCPKCDVYMSKLIGKESCRWVCTMGCET